MQCTHSTAKWFDLGLLPFLGNLRLRTLPFPASEVPSESDDLPTLYPTPADVAVTYLCIQPGQGVCFLNIPLRLVAGDPARTEA